MRETRQSGSEGGAGSISVPTPISTQPGSLRSECASRQIFPCAQDTQRAGLLQDRPHLRRKQAAEFNHRQRRMTVFISLISVYSVSSVVPVYSQDIAR